jgi:peroxiredoxin
MKPLTLVLLISQFAVVAPNPISKEIIEGVTVAGSPGKGITASKVPTVQVSSASHDGQELIGTPAPNLSLVHWINSEPLEIANLHGKVLLLRWWTDTCQLCAATAPSLLKLQDKYGARGFQVIGVFHPKPAGDWNLTRVERAAERYHFTFPVADDGDWQGLKRWWLNSAHREYTSVSFIVDKHGVIRYVHPGGEYHESIGSPAHEICDANFKTIDKTIATLLDEN